MRINEPKIIEDAMENVEKLSEYKILYIELVLIETDYCFNESSKILDLCGKTIYNHMHSYERKNLLKSLVSKLQNSYSTSLVTY